MPNRSTLDTDASQADPLAETLLSSSVEAPQQALARLRAELDAQRLEIERLRNELKLRDRALDATSTQFTICKIADPVSIIVYCNRALAEHHGYQREELINESILKLAPPGWSVDDHRKLQARLLAHETLRFERESHRKDGSTFTRGATIIPLADDQGNVTHSVSISADITGRVEAERKQRSLQDQLVIEMQEREKMAIELRLAQKLESVGRLAAGVAHEINTPIQFVNDSLYFLRTAFEDLNTMVNTCRAATEALTVDTTQDFLRAIDRAVADADLDFLQEEIPKAFERTFDGANRVASIVRAMKEFAHPDGSEHSPADINRALQTTLIVAANEYKYVAIVNTEFGELPYVTCNIGELNQVFLNLIVNAAHAIHDAGKDAGTGGAISLGTALIGDMVEITFADNGCGIPQENLDKIYDPFFTTKEVGRGTGQGLAITRSIVMEKHGGDIRVNSVPGAGTQFTLCLRVDGPKKVEQA